MVISKIRSLYVIKYLICYFQLVFSLGSDLSDKNNKKLDYSIELYFCITVRKPYSSDYKFEFKNVTLQSGKWTEDRYSNKAIRFPNNTLIKEDFTICSKKQNNYEYGPVGRLNIKITNYKNYFCYLYVWWDMAIFENQEYGLNYDTGNEVKIRSLDKNWIRVLDSFPSF